MIYHLPSRFSEYGPGVSCQEGFTSDALQYVVKLYDLFWNLFEKMLQM